MQTVREPQYDHRKHISRFERKDLPPGGKDSQSCGGKNWKTAHAVSVEKTLERNFRHRFYRLSKKEVSFFFSVSPKECGLTNGERVRKFG